MNLKLKISCLILGVLCMSTLGAQTSNENQKPSSFYGISVQAYPAGIIATANLERYISENTSLLFRIGANFTDRQDFSSENDAEEGEGFGGGFGYRKHFPLKTGEVVAGINIDIWNLWIDWRDDVGTTNERSGRTYILVLQPWLEAGYFLPIKNTSAQIGLTLGFGREINVITNGDEVAQDWIASASLHYKFRL